MALIVPIIRNMQTKFKIDCLGDNLEDNHLARIIVYLVNQFEKEKPYLFSERNIEGKIGPKFKNELKEMLGLIVFATFRLQRTCRKIESFLSDNNGACEYITNNELPKKSKINDFKNDYEYLIKEFLIYTVEFGAKFDLVDF